MNEHVRTEKGGLKEWSRQSAATDPETVPDRKIYRLFVTVDLADHTYVEVEDCRVTSLAPGARRMRNPSNRAIALTTEEVEWLLSVLPRAHEHLKKEQAKFAARGEVEGIGKEPVE